MKVLSLFDGISCGMVALSRVGIPVERYVAYEINKYAVEVSRNNFPSIEHKGDVFGGDFSKYKGFDLLMDGSPCTFWSVLRSGREVTSDGEGGRLFMQYIRALRESQCRYFLYENNYSIHKDIKDFISDNLGVEPVTINSSMVSAQSRRRCYWTNIPDVALPEDRGVKLQDILEYGVADREKSSCITCSYAGFQGSQSYKCRRYFGKRINQAVFRDSESSDILRKLWEKDPYFDKDKESPVEEGLIRRMTPIEVERLQTLPDDYTKGIPENERYRCVGNGWTVDVIAHILKGLKKKEETKAPLIGGLFDLFQ